MSEKTYTREELFKIVADNLKVAKKMPRLEQTTTDPEEINRGISNLKEKRLDFNYELAKAVETIRRAFMEAGLRKDLYQIEEKLQNGSDSAIFDYLTNSNDTMSYMEILKKISDLEYELLLSINSNVPRDNDHDPEIMNQLFDDYLAGFIYDSRTISDRDLHEFVLDRVVEIYSFYGLILPRETMEKILKTQQHEFVNYRQKLEAGNDNESVYKPEILGEYIYEDIARRLNVTKKSSSEEKSSLPTNNEPLDNTNPDINEKIDKIKQVLKEYEDLLQKEKECMKELESIRAKKNEIEESISGIRL